MMTRPSNVEVLTAELDDLKSQRRYFVRRVEKSTDLNRSQRRRDLYMIDRRITEHTKMLDRTHTEASKS